MMAAQQRGPTVWNRCRLLSGNSIMLETGETCCPVLKAKTRRKFSGFLFKDWRLPTLAEPIGLLPSARLCLTAEFGMGSGRTTALWPPRNGSQKPAAGSSNFHSELRTDFPTKFKRTNRVNRDSLKTAHRVAEQLLF